MALGKEYRNGRKSSWDSRMSISTISTGARHYRRSASSILSTDSDIRFTRRKLSSQFKCGCCIVASFLLLLLLASAALYVGYTYLAAEPLGEQIYRAKFKVLKGDAYSEELADPSSETYRKRSRDYRERLNLLFRRSWVRYGFAGTEVLALDGNEGKDLVVHFNIRIDPSYVDVRSTDLKQILFGDLTASEPIYFKNLTIDANSLEVKVDAIPATTLPTTAQTKSEAVTYKPKPLRKCTGIQVKYCGNMNYNWTSYPNVLGHENFEQLQEDFISFRELVDAECHRLAYEFVCQVLQPPCKKGDGFEDEMVLPCRSFCRDFMTGCGGRLLPKLKELMDCSRFPEFGEGGSCTTKPGCVQELQYRAQSPRLCDGVIDCQDLSDEKSCTYCSKDQLHCGSGRTCIDAKNRCDGEEDCPDGIDERACLSIGPSAEDVFKFKSHTPHTPQYYSEGYVLFNEKGEIGKLCVENLNYTLPENKSVEILETVASSLCKTLGYEKVTSVEIEKDNEYGIPYVRMKDPFAAEINFVRTSCLTKQVLKVGCENLECGVQVSHMSGINGLSKMAAYGDWPWHAALFKEDIHICDATLLSSEWLLTSGSCFQGQPKAEWTARFGTVRLSSSTPWQQERRVTELIKSPVEGSTVALVRLEDPVRLNDFVRPVCLPKRDEQGDGVYCNTLGWARNRDQLQRVQLKIIEMEKCENVSISTMNSLCTEAMYGQDDCTEEEFTGSSMLCLDQENKWSIIGLTNWRIACSKSGVDRPRMYDKIVSNIDWILKNLEKT